MSTHVEIQRLILTEGGLNPLSANLHNIPELTKARHASRKQRNLSVDFVTYFMVIQKNLTYSTYQHCTNPFAIEKTAKKRWSLSKIVLLYLKTTFCHTSPFGILEKRLNLYYVSAVLPIARDWALKEEEIYEEPYEGIFIVGRPT